MKMLTLSSSNFPHHKTIHHSPFLPPHPTLQLIVPLLSTLPSLQSDLSISHLPPSLLPNLTSTFPFSILHHNIPLLLPPDHQSNLPLLPPPLSIQHNLPPSLLPPTLQSNLPLPPPPLCLQPNLPSPPLPPTLQYYFLCLHQQNSVLILLLLSNPLPTTTSTLNSSLQCPNFFLLIRCSVSSSPS